MKYLVKIDGGVEFCITVETLIGPFDTSRISEIISIEEVVA